MEDRTHNDPNARVRAIVDDGIAELLLLGMASKDSAAVLMAFQAALRVDGNERRKELARLIAELVWDVDDTGDGQ